jgi:hypothetical protein
LRNQKTKSDLNVGALLENGEIKILDTLDLHGDQWHLTDTQLKIDGKMEAIVSDWRDMASHYILTRTPNGKLNFFGFQKSTIVNLNAVTNLSDKEELVRFISPDELEDFILFDREKKVLRTFINEDGGDGYMKVSPKRKFKVKDPKVIEGYLHSIVATNNPDYILLFNDKDLYKLKVDDGSITPKKDMNI